ncbi:hypothetical protein NQ314_007724 [Rhamnusium bicolor]|uniref:Conserved oligomeric Golgi complex subunit 5 n=1 Tax=Rhamnusium bicolor TaxID=1586634 RepID=A0AAV8YKU6_9CUCU|nr:hypothetical protein NQ314_007724 [Rhamnusium bicolor]
MESDKKNVIQQIENDEFYNCFLKSTSKAVLTYSLSINEQVKKLGEGIELLSQELQQQVLEKHDDLLQQANHATKLEDVLNTMNAHVQNLFANAERLKTQVPKQLASDPELKNIDAVTTELRNIRKQQQKVVKLATGSLNQGVMSENITQTTTALQIFINLGTIKTTTDNLIEQNLDEYRECLKTAFDINVGGSSTKNKGGPGRVTLTSSQGFRSKIWTELEKAFSEEIFQICKQVKFLQTTLNTLNLQDIELSIASEFWIKFGEILQEEIKKTSSAVQQMLEEDYPKLLKNYYELTKKLKYDQFAFEVVRGTPNAGQQKNVNLANVLYYLHTQIQRMLFNMKESLPEACVKIISDSLQSLDNLVAAILQPLVASINSIIETIIITIHLETDWSKLPVPTNKNYQSCTPYMRELNQFITRVYQTYLANFENKEVLSTK